MTHSLIRFIVFFVLSFSLLLLLYLQIPDDLLRLTIYPTFIIHPSIFLLEETSVVMNAHSLNNIIYIGENTLEIVRGCDGSSFILIFSAAVISFPGLWREKCFVLLVGVLALWTLNLIRISCLIYLKEYFDDYFYLMHNLILPMIFCLFSLCIFWIWIINTGKSIVAPARHET